MKRLVLSLLFIVCVLASYAREVDPLFGDTIDRTADDFVIASLCVADPTDWRDDFMGVAGHAWIRLQCPIFNLDNCFSYESEPVEGNVWRFITGDLKMGMYCVPTQDYIKDYQNWNRSVHEYRLNLPPAAKQRLWEIMDNHVAYGNQLPWNLERRGCCLSAVRYVHKALEPDTIHYTVWPEVTKLPRAEVARQVLDSYPWHQLLFDWFLYDNYDYISSNEDKLLYATLIVEAWSQATVNGQPLLEYVGDLSTGEPPVVPHIWFTPCVCLLMLIILIAAIVAIVIVIKKRQSRA